MTLHLHNVPGRAAVGRTGHWLQLPPGDHPPSPARGPSPATRTLAFDLAEVAGGVSHHSSDALTPTVDATLAFYTADVDNVVMFVSDTLPIQAVVDHAITVRFLII